MSICTLTSVYRVLVIDVTQNFPPISVDGEIWFTTSLIGFIIWLRPYVYNSLLHHLFCSIIFHQFLSHITCPAAGASSCRHGWRRRTVQTVFSEEWITHCTPAHHFRLPDSTWFDTSWVPLSQAQGWKLEQGGLERLSVVLLDIQAEPRERITDLVSEPQSYKELRDKKWVSGTC